MNAPAPKSVLESAKAVVLDPNTIDVFGRIGFYFPDKAAAFGKLMAIDGQRTPIMVSAQPEGRLPRAGAPARLSWRGRVLFSCF